MPDRSVRLLLRLEGLVVLLAAGAVHAGTGAGWLAFALLLLVPDLSMLGYLAGPRVGAAAYNAAHTYLAPAAVLVVGTAAGWGWAMPAAAVWAAHVGLDRALGYGLKLSTGFRDTHLGRIGR